MILAVFFLLLPTICCAQANSWHGIIPLNSTRADVERILGPPTPDTKTPYAANYKTKNERVFVLYSSGLCDVNSSHGWNVPADTVISISVEPNTKPKFVDLKVDESKYEKRQDPEVLRFSYYTNEEEGISIEVNTDEGVVTTFRFSPVSKDYHQRCPTPADTSILGIVSHKTDEYSDIPFVGERKRLENFRKQMLTYPTTEGYIIAYAGKRAHAGQAQKLAERAKIYLVKRGISSGRIQATDGGHREKWTIELYLIPVGAVAPSAKPTLDSSEVQIIKSRKVGKDRHRLSRSH